MARRVRRGDRQSALGSHELQQVEWFAYRRPEIAHAPRAADRGLMITALRDAGDPLADEFDIASDRAESAVRVARGSGNYPLLSRGDVNIYSLSRLQNSLGCRAQFLDSPVSIPVVLDCRLRVLGREDSSGRAQKRGKTAIDVFAPAPVDDGPGRAPALDRRLADDTLFVTSPGARAGRRSAPARRTCSGTSPLRRRGRGTWRPPNSS